MSVRIDEPSSGVRRLTLDDPDRRNALGPRMLRELSEAIDGVAADSGVSALVVTGAGRVFCAGADLPALFGTQQRAVGEIREDLHEVYDSFLGLLRLEIPTIAAVQGPAVGAGANLALACDIRLVGANARFDFTFSGIGLHPGGGATHFLVSCLGRERALKVLLEGGSITAEAAVSMGLVAGEEPDPLGASLELAEHVAGLEPRLARDIKAAVGIAATSGLGASLQFESWAQASSATGPRIKEVVERFNR